MASLRRKRAGKGFYYVDESGRKVAEPDVIKRIQALAIPPAWNNVEIAAAPGQKIQATGYDAAGRKQYIYHQRYRQQQERKKFDRLLAFANALPMMRKVTAEHLRLKGYPREKVLACMVRLIDTAYFRVGNDQYAKENQTYGLTTLRSRHLTIEKDSLIFDYVGKSHQQQHQEITDRRLAKIVSELDDLPGYEIFKYYDDDGQLVDVSSGDVNAYIKEVMGYDFSAKDFRTWAGTLIAAVALAETEDVSGGNSNKRVVEAIKRVAEMLGNTPAIARASYVDPRIVDHYLNGSTIKWYLSRIHQYLSDPDIEHLSHEEVAVLRLLQRRLRSTSAGRPRLR
jgi:DNA topoisomerase-1